MDSLTDRPDNIFACKYRYAATYGLYFGLYLGFFYLLSILFPDNGLVKAVCMLGNLGSLVFSYILIKKYRDEAMGGYMSFGWTWTFGLWFSAFTALIMAVFHFIHFRFIQPDFIENTLNQSLLMLEEMDYPSEALDALSDFGTPSAMEFTLFYVWFYIIGGAFLSLIYAAFLSRRDTFGDARQDSDDDEYIPYQERKTDSTSTDSEVASGSGTDNRGESDSEAGSRTSDENE